MLPRLTYSGRGPFNRRTGRTHMSSRTKPIGLLAIAVVFGIAAIARPAVAQTGQPRWAKAAPFPHPEEELYGTVVNGKWYVLGGFGIGGNAAGLVVEVETAPGKWTQREGL